MGAFQPWHWIVVAVIVLLLFGGRGKLSSLMGDAAKGIKAFKDGLKNDDEIKSDRSAGALPLREAEKDEARVDR